MIRRGWTGFLGVGNVGRTQDAQCANMSMLNSDSIWQYWHQFISIWHLLAIKAQKMEPDKAWNVTFPTVYITVLVRFYAGLMVHTPTVFHISLCTRPPYPTCVCPTCFGCSSPVKPIYPLCVHLNPVGSFESIGWWHVSRALDGFHSHVDTPIAGWCISWKIHL